MGRDDMGIQSYNGVGKWEHALQLFFDISFFLILWRLALECGKKLLDCSDSGRRILVTQVPKIGYALKLPNNDNKKKIVKKFSHSHKEINQIYQSIHNLMRQAHKEINSATAAALTTALVWSIILDPCRLKIADQG